MENDFKIKPYKLVNEIQNYAWGARGEDAYIPNLLEIETDPDESYAELWIGSHPAASSKVVLGSEKVRLSKFIEKYPVEILGPEVATKFQNELPFLFKILSAREALSIQVHPDKRTAQKLNQKDPEHYPDRNHKPEIAIALDSLEALIGFRPIVEIVQMLDQYTELASFIGKDKVSELEEVIEGIKNPRIVLEDVFSSMLYNAVHYPEKLEKLCQNLSEEFRKNIQNNRTQDKEREKLFLELNGKYKGDVGLLIIFFLNLVKLDKGEAIFMGPGVLHTYLKGNIVECMANSDNVVRAGLTPKYKDIETLVEITKYIPGNIERLNSGQHRREKVKYPAPEPEFNIFQYNLEKNEKQTITNINSVEVLLIIRGQIWLTSKEQDIKLNKGESILIPARMEKYSLKALEANRFFRVNVPVE